LGRRPQIDTELRALIRRMNVENPLWGTPRVHGELLKLGFEIAVRASPSTWSNRTLKALVDCLEAMGVEFLMDDDDAGVGIRVRRPQLHPSISSAREEKTEENGLAKIRNRKFAKKEG
jgi:hypothetical protein